MANNKKVYSITINGLEESIKSVDALTQRINVLQKLISGLKKTEIPIDVNSNIESVIKEIVSLSKKVKGALPIDEEKEYAKALKDREKALQAVNRELGDSGKNAEEFKQETKGLVAEAKKARNEAKTYANTLNGLKAALKDLNSTKGDIDLDSEEYAIVSNKIYELTSRLKELEAAQGSYGRNVGNYSNSILDAARNMGTLEENTQNAIDRVEYLRRAFDELKNADKLDFESISKLGLSAKEIRDELSKVENELYNKAFSDDDYKALEQYRDRLKIVNDELKRFRGEVVKADNQLKTQLQRTINGTTYTWETLTSAVGELEDKLYQLAASGQKNTKEFEAIARVASELKIQLRQVDYEIDTLVESSRGIDKIVTMTQGFTAIAQGASGIGQLFGMDDEDSLKGIQTLQSLQGIAMSLQTISEQRQRGTAFGKMIDSWIAKFEALAVVTSDFFNKFSSNIIDTNKATSKLIGMLDNIANRSSEGLEAIPDLDADWNNDSIKEFIELNGIAGDEAIRLKNRLTELSIANKANNNQLLTSTDILRKLRVSFSDLWLSIKQGARELPIIGKLFGSVATNATSAAEGTVLMTRGARTLTSVVKGLGVALKGISYTLLATGVMALVQIVISLVGALSDWLKTMKNVVLGNDKLVDSVTTLESRIARVNSVLDNYNKQLERANRNGQLSDLGKSVKEYEALQKAIEHAAKELQDFIALRDKWDKRNRGFRPLEDNLGSKGLTNGIISKTTFDNLEEFRKEYENLLDAVEANTDSKQGKSLIERIWYTKSDAKSDLGVMQKRIIEDLQYQINNLDLSKGIEEIGRFVTMLDDEMYSTALANVENLFPEKEWATVLKQRIEQVRDMYKQMDDAAQNSADVASERLRTIRDNETEAIRDEKERDLKTLRNQMADEIKAAKGDQELIISIRAKYQRLEEDMLKKHNDSLLDRTKEYETNLRNLVREIRDNYLSAENDSLNKTIEEINNKRNDEIEDALIEAKNLAKEGVDLTTKYNELVLSINAKYDAEIERTKKDYYKTLLAEYEKYNQELIKVEQGYQSDRLDSETRKIDLEYETSLLSSEGTFDFEADYKERLESEKEFNASRLELELDYLNQKKALDEKYINFDKDDALLQEEDRYKKALDDLKTFRENGQATEEEYNRLLMEEQTLHFTQQERIIENANDRIENLQVEHLNSIKTTLSNSLKNNVTLYEAYVNEVDRLTSEANEVGENIFGVNRYNAAKDKLGEALIVIEEGIYDVDKEILKLGEKLEDGEISFTDYTETIKQLSEIKTDLVKKSGEIIKVLDDLLEDVIIGWKGVIDTYVGQFSSLLNTFNETKMQLIENQISETEHQLELAEEAYERAEDAANAHKDKMNSIEEELADSRGARRQFLIDTLAAQQEAYLEELSTQKNAELEKERLEKQKLALEKKRKEQEKKANVQQAIINTYTAVSNALAVKPWQLGLALSVIALGLGMKNVNAIKATPIYEDGGVIQGARHSQGGVKVLGGTAEVEGGEYITNRKSTAANLPLLEMINSKKREITAEDLINFFANGVPKVSSKTTKRFAQGGQLPTVDANEVNKIVQVVQAEKDDRPIVVSVVDIINQQDNLRRVQTLAGLN